MWQKLIERWNAETPKVFAWIRNSSIAIGGSAFAVWQGNSLLTLNLATPVLDVCKYTIAACFALGLPCQFTKKKDTDAT